MKSWFRRLFFKIAAIANNPSRRRSKLRRDRPQTSGFTLLELIVAALIASLMVVVMMTFLVGVLDSDRRETAKSNAQEELQAAIAYIADDLQEAMYIYGAEGIAGINDQLPHVQTNTQCTSIDCTPILVFWKRASYDPNTLVGSQKLGCMPYTGADAIRCASENPATNPYLSAFGRDIYAYSLVAYYLKSDVNLIGPTWSNTARILRWELRDGYPWSCSNGGNINDTANCPTTLAVNRNGISGNPPAIPVNSTNPSITPIPIPDNNYYFTRPDQGFNRPDFSSATSILSWRRFTPTYDLNTNPFTTLVDFMDDTAYDATQGGNNDATGTGAIGTAALRIPIGKNVTISGVVTNPDCDDPSIGVGNTNPVTTTNAVGTVTQRIPADFSSATINPSGLSSFYACVAPNNVTVRLFLRGNALARMGNPAPLRSFRQPSAGNTSFFPTANVRSFGRSAIGISK
jgi:type II secretory pathway pseudopilin PulG